MIERNIDCRKHRKSTHLASADLDAMVLEKKDLIFTITDVKYETGVDVSGTKKDAYFVKFKEHPKEMLLNSTNRKTLAAYCRDLGFLNHEMYNIGNWVGMTVELYVDRNVKFMGNIVDGIRIKEKKVEPLTEKESKIIEAKITAATTKQALKDIYNSDIRIKTNKIILDALNQRKDEVV